MDERARELERKARRTGEQADWTAYLANLRVGLEQVRETCYEILAENPEGAKQPALEKLVQNGGVWIERDELPDGDGFLHVHGLRDQTTAIQQPYTLSLQRQLFRNPSRESQQRETGIHFFTQLTLAHLLVCAPLQPPTTKQLDALSRALVIARAHDRQPRLSSYATGMIRDDIFGNNHTSTRVSYWKDATYFIHGFGNPTLEVIKSDIQAADEILTTIPAHNFAKIAKDILGTTETAAQVDARYRALTNRQPPSYALIMGRQKTERAVHFGVTGGERPFFCIDASVPDLSQGATRLVKTTPIVAAEGTHDD